MNHITFDEMKVLLTPGPHGGEGEQLAKLLGVSSDAVCDLSASLNPLAPDVVAIAGRCLDELRRYPDPASATDLLADAIGVDPKRLLLTNGGSEAIALVAGDMRTGQVIEPEFSLYRRHLDSISDSAPRWRSNPNNPTGLLADPDDTAAAWDEAFYPLATGTWTRGDANAVVVGSLTKLFACPGLRLGYVLSSDEDLIERLARHQPTWSVNGLALGVLPHLLEATELAKWASEISKLRDELASLLVSYGFRPMPSDASWLLVPEANDLRAKLATQAVLVRDCTSFGMPNTIRIAIPTPNNFERLDKALSLIC